MDELEVNKESISEPQEGVTDKKQSPRKMWVPRLPDAKKSKILELYLLGNTHAQIAAIIGKPEDFIWRVLKVFKPVLERLPAVNDYRSSKSDFLAAGQIAALETGLSPKKLSKSSAKQCIDIFDTLNKAERLENNQSTENISNKFFGTIELVNVSSANDNQPIDVTEE